MRISLYTNSNWTFLLLRFIMCILLLFIIFISCKTNQNSFTNTTISNKANKNVTINTTEKNNNMITDSSLQIIHQWKEAFKWTYNEALEKFQIPENSIESDLSYFKLQELTAIDYPPFHPGLLYYDKTGRLQIIHIDSDSEALSKIKLTGLKTQLGTATATLPSRAGKGAVHYVYAEKGIAFSVLDGVIAYLELFPSLSTEAYIERIYIEPPAFVK